MRITCLALLLVFAACDGARIENPIKFPDPREDIVDDITPEFLVVAQYDEDGDDSPDMVTLDASATPYRIVEMIGTRPGGGAVDKSAAFAGREIDPRISDAIAAHISDALASDGNTVIEVVDSTGRAHTVRLHQ